MEWIQNRQALLRKRINVLRDLKDRAMHPLNENRIVHFCNTGGMNSEIQRIELCIHGINKEDYHLHKKLSRSEGPSYALID